MLSAALLLLQALPAAAPPPTVGADVIVVGRSLRETEEALRACLARRCPPREDIDASLAHAENQFLTGDANGARTTLTASRGRNKRYASTLPEPVAELLRVDALVASLVGEREYARIGTIDSVSALKAGLPRDNPKIAAQRLQVAAVFAREGRLQTATNMYDAVAERAAEMGWGALQGEAMFRAAALYALVASIEPSYATEARKRLDRLEHLQSPAAKPYVDAAVLIQVKVAELRKDDAALAAARARARALRADRATLVYAPPIDLGDPTLSGGNVDPVVDTRGQWVDLSFTVAPDGRVRDVEEIGRGEQASGRWIDVARDTIAQREYVPLTQPADGPGLDQVERAMLVSDLAPAKGTRLRSNSVAPRIQYVNMTARSQPPPAAGSARGD